MYGNLKDFSSVSEDSEIQVYVKRRIVSLGKLQLKKLP